MDFQQKLRNFLGGVQQGASNFFQGAQQAVAPVAQNVSHFGQGLVNQIQPQLQQAVSTARPFVDQQFTRPVTDYVSKAIDNIPNYINPPALGGSLTAPLFKGALKMGASSLIDQPSSLLRGADFIVNPQRRQEIGQGSSSDKIGAFSDVSGLLPILPLGRVSKIASKLPIEQSSKLSKLLPESLSELPQSAKTLNFLKSAKNGVEAGIQNTTQLAQKQLENLPFDDIVRSSDINVKDKIGLFDYFRTPDRVFKKVGLENESNQLRQNFENYRKELPIEIDKVTQWAKRVLPEGNVNIFKYLDGQPVQLDPNELQVATEVKDYLKGWADKLGLPEDKRITNYITHIFDKDLITKEFDPDIAKLIRDKIPGSVYDPFTEQRLGKLGYKEDTWQALDAYIKRATRKVNLDPALDRIKQVSGKLEEGQYDYVKGYLDHVNLRPSKWENIADNTLKQLFGYKFGQRPLASLSQGARQMIYRGTLGLNPGSAIKNLTQGANTYAKLGEKYTVIGYANLAKSIATRSKELEDVGVLSNDLVQDRTLNATKKFWERTDKVLFSFFEAAEKINRGSAYFGAKAKGLNEGLSEEQAIEYAKKIVRDTQFSFSNIDTPTALQGNIGKTLLQFQSYNTKQTEFLAEMIKNKEFAGLVRWAGASLGLVLTVGQSLGMKPQDLIPSLKVGASPLFTLAGDLKDTVTGARDQYGNTPKLESRVKKLGKDLIPFVPAGTQIKKTFFSKQESDASSGFPLDSIVNAQDIGSEQPTDGQLTPVEEARLRDQLATLKKKETGVLDNNGISLPIFGQVGGTNDDQKNQELLDLQVQEATINDQLKKPDTQKQIMDSEYSLLSDRLTRAGDSANWVKVTEAYISNLQDQQQKLDPIRNKADITTLQNKIEDLQVKVDKYKSQGGFKAPKKAKAIKGVNFMKAAGIKTSKRKSIKSLLPKYSQKLAKAPMVKRKSIAFKLGKV